MKTKNWFISRIGKYILYKSIFDTYFKAIRISNKKKANKFFLSQKNKIAEFKKHPNVEKTNRAKR